MAFKKSGLLGVSLLLVGVGGHAQSPAPERFPPEQIKRGAELYVTNCQACHGVNMIGPQWGTDLATFPRDKPERFVDSVSYGKNAMPPWGDVLKLEEIQALWAYVVAGEAPQ